MKRSDKKKVPKRVLRLPDLDFAKRSVLKTLGSPASKRAYWLAFSRTVVLRHRTELEAADFAPRRLSI